MRIFIQERCGYGYLRYVFAIKVLQAEHWGSNVSNYPRLFGFHYLHLVQSSI